MAEEEIEKSVNSPQPERKYGWKRDNEDEEFPVLRITRSSVQDTYPPKLILHNLPPVYDQGALGSCTANALGGAFEFEQMQAKFHVFTPSRLFIYYGERNIEGTVPIDNGASISSGIKVMTNLGVCAESIWPYDIKKFTVKPNTEAFKDAMNHKVVVSRKIRITPLDFKTMINLGDTVAFGFKVYESFEKIGSDGIMPMPSETEEYKGGHAVLAVGYDDDLVANGNKGFLYVRNSWGVNFGINGYFWMPYDYLTRKNANDAWVISKNIDLDKQVKDHLNPRRRKNKKDAKKEKI